VLLGKVDAREFAFGASTQNVHDRPSTPRDTDGIPEGSLTVFWQWWRRACDLFDRQRIRRDGASRWEATLRPDPAGLVGGALGLVTSISAVRKREFHPGAFLAHSVSNTAVSP
jgi:hypothetical protein